MKPSSYVVRAGVKVTSTSTSDVQTATIPTDLSAVLITCETSDGRLTLDGTDPSAGAYSHLIPRGQPPILLLLGAGTVIKWVSTAAGNSILQITPLQ